jgi:hypothetical protein
VLVAGSEACFLFIIDMCCCSKGSGYFPTKSLQVPDMLLPLASLD